MDPSTAGFSRLKGQYEFTNHESVPANSDHDVVGVINDGNLIFPGYGVGNINSFSRRSDCDFSEESDFSDTILKYINQVLMEDDLEDEACTIEDSTLQVAEKSFCDVLNTKHHTSSPSPNQSIHLPDESSSNCCSSSSAALNSPIDLTFLSNSSPISPLKCPSCTASLGIPYPNGYQRKSKAGREIPRHGIDLEEERRKKHSPIHAEESLLGEMLDKMMHFVVEDDGGHDSTKEGFAERGSFVKKRVNRKDAFDMKSLLLQCMESVASHDYETAQKLLNQIKKLSSPRGNSFQRLGHCFAKGLESRLAGTGSVLYKDLTAKSRSSSNALRAYHLYISTVPFMNAGNYLESKTIMGLAEKAKKLHLIKFGIRQGVRQIPLIQHLSARPGGPPKLKVTGIEFPQPGFRPAAMVEETGLRLASYCKNFNVPFEYHPISKKWETITPEEIKIEKDEVVVVMCLYQLHLLDDTILEDSPRDAVLSLIRKLNPDIFIHGVSNAPYNSPFFVSRFREALFHFSSLFDLFEATMPHDDMRRMVFETDICGKDIVNIIGCEGVERVERPETYKKWQARILRAGFRQLPLDQEMVNKVKAKVKKGYHEDFFVEESSQWMVQGWKGRVLVALSCWKPA